MSGKRRMLAKQRRHDAEMAAKQAELDEAKAAQAAAEARPEGELGVRQRRAFQPGVRGAGEG